MRPKKRLHCPNGAVRFVLAMPVDWHHRFKQAAKASGKSLTLLVNELAMESFERGDQIHKKTPGKL